MSRRRFFNPSTTYHSFISNIEEYKDPSGVRHETAIDVFPKHDIAALPASRQYSPLTGATLISNSYRPANLNGNQTISHGNSVDIWLSRRNLDAVIKRKSLLIFLNGMLGIAIMIAILQASWDSTTQTYHDYDPPGHLPIILSLKIACALSSCFLVYQMLDRKQLQVSIKYREKRRKMRAIKPPLSTVSLISLLSLRPSTIRPKLWIQVLCCFWHPFPFTDFFGLYLSNKLGLLMLFRLHLVFRVIRDHSEIWLNRRSIKRLTAFSSRTPDFDWWLSVKTVLYRRPIAFASGFYGLCILIFGYCTYIFEREAQPDLFTMPIGFFVAYQCITIDWASDVYDVYNPITRMGKATCLVAAMMGLLLTSFIIGIVSQSVMPSKFEETALNCIHVEKAREKEKENAARLIQFVWRNHRHEKELAEKLGEKNPRLFEEISAIEEKEFMEEFLARSKALRNTRRERIDLEDQLVLTERTARLNDVMGRELDGAMNKPSRAMSTDFEVHVMNEIHRLASRQDELIELIKSQMSDKALKRRRRKREIEEAEVMASKLARRARKARRTGSTQHLDYPSAGPSATASPAPSADIEPIEEVPNEPLAEVPLSPHMHVFAVDESKMDNNMISLSERSEAENDHQHHEGDGAGQPLLGSRSPSRSPRRVRSMSPHSAALATLAIQAMTGSTRRRTAPERNRRASLSGPVTLDQQHATIQNPTTHRASDQHFLSP